MVISASTTPLTRNQLEYLRQEYGAELLNIDVGSLLDNELSKGRLSDIDNKLYDLSCKNNIFGLRVAEKQDMVMDLILEASRRKATVDVLSRRINNVLARIAINVLDSGISDLKGVYLTGGDMTVAFCQALEADTIEIRGEVLPLAAYGILVGGRLSGLRIVTKGGLVGTDESAAKCVDYLLNRS